VNGRLTPTARALRGALRRMNDGKAWARGEYARTGDGYPVNTQSPNARRWCASGALHADDDAPKRAWRLLVRAAHAEGYDTVEEVNDRPFGWTAVRRLYLRAIQYEREGRR